MVSEEEIEKWNKMNRILDDFICIVAIVIFPMFLLKLLGYDKLTTKQN